MGHPSVTTGRVGCRSREPGCECELAMTHKRRHGRGRREYANTLAYSLIVRVSGREDSVVRRV